MSDRDVSEAEFDRAVSTVLGRTPAADQSLLRDLEEAGATAAGARGVLHWLDDGVSAERAVSVGLGFFDVQPGRVAQLVEQRALEVLRRHRPDVASSPSGATVSESSSSSDPSAYEGGEVAAAREAIVQAALERGRGYIRVASEQSRLQIAEAAAKGVVESMTDWAVRDGWTHQRLAERLQEHAAAIRAGRVGGGAASARGTVVTNETQKRAVTVTEAGTAVRAGGRPADTTTITEADAAKAIASAFGYRVEETGTS